MLRVLGRSTSINVRKVLWLCDELGIPYSHETWATPERPTSDPSFLRLNPNGLVPVIVDGDFVLRESNTICRYLASAHERDDLLPRAPKARAVVEQWMDWHATDLNAAWRYAFMSLVRKNPDYQDARAVSSSVETWNRLMRILDAQLQETGAYACGTTFTLADIGLGLSIHRWLLTPIERPPLLAVDAYVKKLAERPGHRDHCANGTP